MTIFCSCSEYVKQENYISKDIEIDFPVGWNMTDNEDFGAGKYFAIEKSGLSSSGLVTISFLEKDYDLQEWINLNIKEIQSNLILQKADVKFEKIEKSKFQNTDALSANYKMKLLGLAHSGKIYAFAKNGKVFAFIQQGADEDSSGNIEGFDHLQNNLKIK